MNPALITSARPLTYSARGSDREHGQVGEHPGRRVERADQVLARRDVHRGLAADRGVDHRQQRGRHQHQPHPAQPGGGDEPGQVGGGPAADADDRVGAGDPAARPAGTTAPAATLMSLAASPAGTCVGVHLGTRRPASARQTGRAISSRPSGAMHHDRRRAARRPGRAARRARRCRRRPRRGARRRPGSGSRSRAWPPASCRSLEPARGDLGQRSLAGRGRRCPR